MVELKEGVKVKLTDERSGTTWESGVIAIAESALTSEQTPKTVVYLANGYSLTITG